jgi:AraC-like DNA-binding protein
MSEIDRAAVLANERHILATEGPYHVHGAYYANEYDADRRRRWAAERIVREARRRQARERTAPVAPRPRIGTWLTPRERSRVELVVSGQVELIHRDVLHAIHADLISGRIDATLVSAAVIRAPDVSILAEIVRDFPGNSIVGVVAEVEESQALARVLAFGHAGVQFVVDARTASGWSALRTALVSQRMRDTFIQRAIRDLAGAIPEITRPTAGWTRFLVAAFAPHMVSCKQIAASLGVGSSTLTSRFYRAGLPSPKRYIAHARLVWAARLGETPGLSISAIAHRLDASSPQSFGRMVRALTGVTAADFRNQFDGAAMLERFRAELVEPYREKLQSFDPLDPGPTEPTSAHAAHSAGRVSHGSGRAA